MPEIRFTEFVTDLQLRESTEDGDPRLTLEGIAVPANERGQIGPDEYERILPTAFEGSENVILTSLHGPKGGVPIGTVHHFPSPEGIRIRARISDTQAARDAVQLLRDGVYRGLSVGYYAGRSSQDPDGTYVRETGRLFETALVPSPAFAGALVTSLRDTETTTTTEPDGSTLEGQTMPDAPNLADVAADVVHLREANEDLTRRLAMMNTGATPPPASVTRYSTAGQWIKGLVQGEDEAWEVYTRDYTGTTTADTAVRPAYVADAIALVQQNRVALQAFSQAPLPPEGMSVDFIRLASDDTTAAEQVAEGDDLAYSHLSLTHASAPVKTYGSWTSMSIQAAQRSPVSVIDLTYRAMVNQVAKVTDTAFITALAAAATVAPIARDSEDIVGWSDAIVKAELQLAANGIGQPAEFILTDLVTFGSVAKFRGDNAIPFLIPQGVQALQSLGTVNTMNYYGVRGSILGLPILVDPLLPSGTTYVANSAAMTTYGAPTPTRLQGDPDSSQIKNLTTALAVYQLQSITSPFPQSIVAITA